jgi:excisionase family DNA binding protein
MSLVSISEAAKLVGRDRKTLYRAIKEGRLSATQDATGTRQVDISELARVFGVFPVARDSGETVSLPQTETGQTTADLKARLAALEAENAQLRERVADKDRHIEDMRQTVRLLEHQTPRKGRWWPWSKG